MLGVLLAILIPVEAAADPLQGAWRWLSDSSGETPRAGATVYMRGLPKSTKKSVAKWAWSQYLWMRSRMSVNAVAESGVWGLLCAAHDGTGPCGFVDDSDPANP